MYICTYGSIYMYIYIYSCIVTKPLLPTSISMCALRVVGVELVGVPPRGKMIADKCARTA